VPGIFFAPRHACMSGEAKQKYPLRSSGLFLCRPPLRIADRQGGNPELKSQ
jgi:hypothetical protein